MAKSKKSGTKSRSALRREREKELRRKTILNIAESLFAKQGYHRTGMEEIADMAEVSVGTVYFYFKNKEDILINLIGDVGFQLRKLVGEEFKKADASLDGIQKAGVAFFGQFCAKYPEKAAILFREAVGQSQEVEEHRKSFISKVITDLKNALERVAEKQDIKYRNTFSAEVMAVCIMGIYEQMACHYLLWNDRSEDIVALGEDAVCFTIGGVESMV
ncbi:TetR/AcrR family transcriptional regulator [Desulfobacterales bacterium HSG16]|nr:TetR/AcrR family transcriptional regulator [Desulfobacterales bacterium HSG16]